MKRIFITLAMAAILLIMYSCSATPDTYTVTEGGITYTVNTKNSIISDGETEYKYSISGSGSNYTITITHPDKGEFVFNKNGDGFTSGLGDLDDSYDFENGLTLCKVLEKEAPKRTTNFGVFGSVVLLVFGMFNIFFPKTALNLAHGWLFKNAEPTAFALNMYRVSGVLLVIIALVIIFV